LARLRIGEWRPEHRAALCGAACLLGTVWPEMLAEMVCVIHQVALLDGYGIEGFTDFTTHGAVFVNAARFDAGYDDLPVEVRLAEALVHEGTHNRCNAAAVSQPFLTPDGHDDAWLVHTPLRADPRPLGGLFQQLVVLIRCVALYDRLLERGGDGYCPAVLARRDRLAAQARQAVETTEQHAPKLTDAGRAVLEEAAAGAVPRAPAWS
jgi:HEXXH motif-containing protein